MENTLQLINEQAPVFFSSFSTDEPAGEVKALKAMAPAQFNLTDMVNKEPITIDSIFLEEVTFENECGEMERGIRTVIFDEMGRTYQTSSMSIVNSLRRILQIKKGSINGLKVKVSTVQTKKGYRAFILIPA